MVLNVVGSNPTGHPKTGSRKAFCFFCVRSDENRQVRNRRSRLATHQFLSKKFKTLQKKKNFHGFRHNYFLAGREAGRFAGKNMKIKELCMDERPREKMMAKGADSLSNAEPVSYTHLTLPTMAVV